MRNLRTAPYLVPTLRSSFLLTFNHQGPLLNTAEQRYQFARVLWQFCIQAASHNSTQTKPLPSCILHRLSSAICFALRKHRPQAGIWRHLMMPYQEKEELKDQKEDQTGHRSPATQTIIPGSPRRQSREVPFARRETFVIEVSVDEDRVNSTSVRLQGPEQARNHPLDQSDAEETADKGVGSDGAPVGLATTHWASVVIDGLGLAFRQSTRRPVTARAIILTMSSHQPHRPILVPCPHSHSVYSSRPPEDNRNICGLVDYGTMSDCGFFNLGLPRLEDSIWWALDQHSEWCKEHNEDQGKVMDLGTH
ncbi:hypothetical protein V8F06_010174 [Rhypophila decipiens]